MQNTESINENPMHGIHDQIWNERNNAQYDLGDAMEPQNQEIVAAEPPTWEETEMQSLAEAHEPMWLGADAPTWNAPEDDTLSLAPKKSNVVNVYKECH